MLTQGEGAARVLGGQTNNTIAQGFITLQTAGIRELAQALEDRAKRLGRSANFKPIVRKGAQIIAEGYAMRAGNVTGNLGKSVKIKVKEYGPATTAIVGPLQTGNKGATDKQASGNAAWIVEFGTGRRRPGTQGRRTYLNVHQSINGKMRRHSTQNNTQFANMSKGYYFLMGSKNEPTRQARSGIGYPHDFGFTDGRQHPITLHPGDTYAAMPARHPMERTINAEQQRVFNTLKSALENALESMS